MVVRKRTIPKALKEAVWVRDNGRKFEAKCATSWCKNMVTVYDFQAGHDIPESKGGELTLDNLYPICQRCNLSMADNYTFKEWCALGPRRSWWEWITCRGSRPGAVNPPATVKPQQASKPPRSTTRGRTM
jgi:hypothetical protein